MHAKHGFGTFVLLLLVSCCCRSDLDIIILLRCNNPKQQHFDKCRKQLLGQVKQQLCTELGPITPLPAESTAEDKDQLLIALAAGGWEPLDCVPHYFLSLRHRVLCMQLDIQVRPVTPTSALAHTQNASITHSTHSSCVSSCQ